MNFYCKDCGWKWISKLKKNEHGHIVLGGNVKSEVEMLKEEIKGLREIIKLKDEAFSLLIQANKIYCELLDEQI